MNSCLIFFIFKTLTDVFRCLLSPFFEKCISGFSYNFFFMERSLFREVGSHFINNQLQLPKYLLEWKSSFVFLFIFWPLPPGQEDSERKKSLRVSFSHCQKYLLRVKRFLIKNFDFEKSQYSKIIRQMLHILQGCISRNPDTS